MHPHDDKTVTYATSDGNIRRDDVILHVKLTFNCSYALQTNFDFLQ